MTAEAARAAFARAFGRSPEVVASAPGRVNLIGEHTDYNGGDVLPIAISSRTYVAMGHASGAESRVVSTQYPIPGRFALRSAVRSGSWWDYVAGPLTLLISLGLDIPNVWIAVVSDVPAGAGLSSSAALEIATLVAVAALCGADAGLAPLARAAHRAEVDFVGMPSGIMDQFASALARPGHALWLACDTEHVEHVPFNDAVLVFDTGTPRALRDSAYAERRAECERAHRALRARFRELRYLARATPDQVRAARLPPPLADRALHVVEETARVGQAVIALRSTGHIPGKLLFASQRSLRDHYDCSTPELDWFVEEASGKPGITGARLTGAGWGGCAIAVGTSDALHALATKTEVAYRARFSRKARWWITHASAGAGVDWIADT